MSSSVPESAADDRSNTRDSTLLCLVSLPPPLTGRTIATERFLERLGRMARLTVVDLSGGERDAREGRVGKALNSLVWILRLVFGASRRFDHVYLVANHGAGLWFDLAFAALARLWNTPVIVHHHVFSYFNHRRRRVALLFWLTGRRCRHLLLCEGMRSACRVHYPTSAELIVLPNFGSGTGLEQGASPSPERGDSLLQVVFISNLTREKGIGDVLSLVRRLSGRRVVFRVAGPAMDGEIRQALEACAREFPENFEWLGPVDAETRDGLLAGADLFLFPTRYANEAQPLVLIEALEAGVPVLANDRGCIADMLGQESQWLVTDESAFVDTATATIERMLDDDGFRAAARVMAPQRAAALAAHASEALEDFAREL